MTPPTTAALRAHEKRIADMLADPECVGELLLVGLVFARCVDFGDPPMATVVRDAGKLIYGRAVHGASLHHWGWSRRDEVELRAAEGGYRRVRDVLRSDIRRYVPDLSKAYFCQRPVKVRQQPADGNLMAANVIVHGDGTPPPPAKVRICGRTTARLRDHLFVDPVDGTRIALGACSQARCQAWWQALRARNDAEIAANPPPEPVANRGGVLERHLDEIDWWKLWQHLDPRWTPPHEAPGWRPPKLQIVVTDDPEPVEVGPRPALTVLKGGWT
jgi:hypothetical protein